MLEQIADSGLYVMREPVCSPGPREILPENLDVRRLFHIDDEASNELVRRLLEFNYERNRWVGVSWTAITARLCQERDRYAEMAEKNRPAEHAYQQSRNKYLERNKWTLGLYGYFQKEPLEPVSLQLFELGKRVRWASKDRLEDLELAAMRLADDSYLRTVPEISAGGRRTNVYFLSATLVLKYLFSDKA